MTLQVGNYSIEYKEDTKDINERNIPITHILMINGLSVPKEFQTYEINMDTYRLINKMTGTSLLTLIKEDLDLDKLWFLTQQYNVQKDL